MSKYNGIEQNILMRALDNNGVIERDDLDWCDQIENLTTLGALAATLDRETRLTKAGTRAARALINLYKANKGKPGHCAFCGCPEDSHGIYPDGSEDWNCPRCGFCEDYHLPKPKRRIPKSKCCSDARYFYGVLYSDFREVYGRFGQWSHVEKARADWLGKDPMFDYDTAIIFAAYRSFQALHPMGKAY